MVRTLRGQAFIAGSIVLHLLLAVVPAAAAPGGDALIEATTITVAAGATPAGSAVVMCPAGTRATGGGAAPVSPEAGLDNYRVQVSGPVDSTGATVTTDTGDIPRGWAATVSHFRNDRAEDFKVFVLCSRSSDAVIQAAPADFQDSIYQGAPRCPAGRRAIGGGSGSLAAVEDGHQDYVTFSSHPVDATLTTAETANGDVAKAWSTSLLIQNDGTTPRLFSICSASSDAKVRSTSFTLPGTGSSTGSDTLTCPAGTRALSGGLGTNAAVDQASDRLEYSAPLDGSDGLAKTGDGDIARRWISAARNNSGAPRTFRVMALCATSEPRPDAHIKRSSDSAFVGQDVYSPTNQVRSWSATRGQTRSFNLRFENDGEDDTFTIRGCTSRNAATVTYVNANTGTNVTSKVTGNGLVFSNVAHGERRSLVLRLKPTSSAAIGSAITCRVTVTSALKTTVGDEVTARLNVVRS